MIFRNLTLFRLSPAAAAEIKDIETALGEHRLKPVGPLEMASHGFVSPYGEGEDKVLTQVVSPFVLVCVGSQDKLLPGSVVNDEVGKRVAKIREEEDRKVGGKERKRIKEDVLNDLLPRAFVRSSRQSFYIDTKEGWVVLDTASAKSAENAISTLRNALGSFPAVPLAPEEGVRVLMTDWLATGQLPEDLAMGEDCELKDLADSQGATIRAKKQDLSVEEIKEHLRAGKQVTQLGLVYKERLSFVLDENLVVRRLKFLDVVMEGVEHGEDASSEADAMLALMTLEVRELLNRLATIFKVPAPKDAE